MQVYSQVILQRSLVSYSLQLEIMLAVQGVSQGPVSWAAGVQVCMHGHRDFFEAEAVVQQQHQLFCDVPCTCCPG